MGAPHRGDGPLPAQSGAAAVPRVVHRTGPESDHIVTLVTGSMTVLMDKRTTRFAVLGRRYRQAMRLATDLDRRPR